MIICGRFCIISVSPLLGNICKVGKKQCFHNWLCNKLFFQIIGSFINVRENIQIKYRTNINLYTFPSKGVINLQRSILHLKGNRKWYFLSYLNHLQFYFKHVSCWNECVQHRKIKTKVWKVQTYPHFLIFTNSTHVFYLRGFHAWMMYLSNF